MVESLGAQQAGLEIMPSIARHGHHGPVIEQCGHGVSLFFFLLIPFLHSFISLKADNTYQRIVCGECGIAVFANILTSVYIAFDHPRGLVMSGRSRSTGPPVRLMKIRLKINLCMKISLGPA